MTDENVVQVISQKRLSKYFYMSFEQEEYWKSRESFHGMMWITVMHDMYQIYTMRSRDPHLRVKTAYARINEY